MRVLSICVLVALAALCVCPAQAAGGYGYGKCNTRDFWKAAVPDTRTAIAIAESVSAAHGFRPLADYRPFEAHLDRNIWRVTSRKPVAGRKSVAVEIDRCDGTVKMLVPSPAR
jgi:hypothetical protein